VADSHSETDIGYEGWRVAGAASVGVFVSFASLLSTHRVLLKPLAEEFAWSRESVSAAFGIAAITVQSARRRGGTSSIVSRRRGSSSCA
jgi:hypothetical protein